MMFWWEQPRRRIKCPDDWKRYHFKEQKGRCRTCGIKLGIDYFECDHKIPFSRGGKDTLKNFQLLCAPCNKAKGQLTDGEFRNLFELTPARKAKGPPSRRIPRAHFDRISKELKREAARERRAMKREEEAYFNPWGL